MANNTAKTLQDSVFHLQSFASLNIETFKPVETKVWWVGCSGSKTQPKDITVRLRGIRWQDDVLETARLETVWIAGNSSRGIKQMDAQDKMLALDVRLGGDLRWHFALTGKKHLHVDATPSKIHSPSHFEREFSNGGVLIPPGTKNKCRSSSVIYCAISFTFPAVFMFDVCTQVNITSSFASITVYL